MSSQYRESVRRKEARLEAEELARGATAELDAAVAACEAGNRQVANRQLSRQVSSRYDSIGRKFNWSARSSWISEVDLAASLGGGAGGEQVVPVAGEHDIEPSWKRYVILLLFCLNSGNKSFQWIEIVALSSKASEFYQVDNYVINVTSIVFLLSFILLSWPACLLIESLGLRRAVLLASLGTALGSAVKCFSCEPSEQAGGLGIGLLLAGQVAVSLSEQLIFSVPSRLASVWFPDREVSRAVAFSFFGNQLGVALGFLLPNWLMRGAETRQQVGAVFWRLFLGNTLYSVAVLLACCWLFEEQPEKAPGKARWRQRELERATERHARQDNLCRLVLELFRHIGALLRNANLLLLALSFGLTVGVNNTLLTLLEQMLAPAWPGQQQVVGTSGFVFVISGATGVILFGWIMDKTHAYKSINVGLVLGSLLSTSLFAYALSYQRSLAAIYLCSALIGTFITALMATCLEYAVELTYPAPELVTSSVMNVMPQIVGAPAIQLGSYIIDTCGLLACNLFYLAQLLAGLLLLLATRERLLRQQEVAEQAEREAAKKQPQPQQQH